MRLKDKVAIITGSTSGIGEAAARRFAQEGASVVVTGRRLERGQALIAEIEKEGNIAHFICADITEESSYKKIVEETIATFGRVDILVNNAGKIIEKPFVEFTSEDWAHFVKLDAYAYFRMMQEVLPQMEAQKSGNIINVTSLAAISVMPTHGLYSFVKGRRYTYV